MDRLYNTKTTLILLDIVVLSSIFVRIYHFRVGVARICWPVGRLQNKEAVSVLQERRPREYLDLLL